MFNLLHKFLNLPFLVVLLLIQTFIPHKPICPFSFLECPYILFSFAGSPAPISRWIHYIYSKKKPYYWLQKQIQFRHSYFFRILVNTIASQISTVTNVTKYLLVLLHLQNTRKYNMVASGTSVTNVTILTKVTMLSWNTSK